MQSQAALVEGFTNAVCHAHRDLPSDTPIDIEVRLDQSLIELRVWNWGDEFDLRAFMETLPAELDIEAESGRGLRIISNICDQVDYIRLDDQRNCLYMIKRWEP